MTARAPALPSSTGGRPLYREASAPTISVLHHVDRTTHKLDVCTPRQQQLPPSPIFRASVAKKGGLSPVHRWGSDDGPSSALPYAELLAPFGPEGVSIATGWTAPDPGARMVDAIRLFLDYDGAGSRLIGKSVEAATDDPDVVGAYAVATSNVWLLVLLFHHKVMTRHTDVAVAAGLNVAPDRLFCFDPSHSRARVGTVTPPVPASRSICSPAPRTSSGSRCRCWPTNPSPRISARDRWRNHSSR